MNIFIRIRIRIHEYFYSNTHLWFEKIIKPYILEKFINKKRYINYQKSIINPNIIKLLFIDIAWPVDNISVNFVDLPLHKLEVQQFILKFE